MTVGPEEMNNTWRKMRHLRMMDRGYIVCQDDWYLTQPYWNSLCIHFSKAKVLVNDCHFTIWPPTFTHCKLSCTETWQLSSVDCSTLLVLSWLTGVYDRGGDCSLFCGWLRVQYATCARVLSVLYHLQSVHQWISATLKTPFTNKILLYIAAHVFTPNRTVLWYD